MHKNLTLSIAIFLFIIITLTRTPQDTIYAYSQESLYTTSSPLKINVVSDKDVYNVGENVQICGNLTYYDELLPDRLVALEIDDSNNFPFLFRTLATGTNLTGSWKIELTKVFPGDDKGNQLYSVKRGSSIYIWVFFQNNFNDSVRTAIAYTIYDAKNAPIFAISPIEYSVAPGGPWNTSYRWTVPTDAELGNATIYASAFTTLPKSEGVPHCPEISETFTIVSQTTASITYKASQSVYQLNITGNYNLTFTLPDHGIRLGNYTVFVAAAYKGIWELFPATNTTKFKVILLGDINDDRKVDVKDLVLLIKAYGSYPDDPNWNPKADLNGDNKVDIKDLVILIKNYGNYA
ncbi:MAG: dockerin type I domain-containing protein [Candidatus Bathyarchaeota archaeon]|nr:dockerin type I domain-containing protein [Candidatus Bathyarchaeota archaeon]